jgi:DNA-binding XRE family transcriptional regulator
LTEAQPTKNNNNEEKLIQINFRRVEMRDPVQSMPANNLKALRQAQRLALWGLATRTGSSATTLSAIERWGYRPGGALCQRIATALGVAVEDIWPDANTTGPEPVVPSGTQA